jgi:sugar/nucleoside kinase (ribokinase family)
MGFDVVCVGSATVDTYLDIDQKFKSISLGNKILTKKHTSLCGGGAINASHALKMFGLKVGLITKLGDDHNGRFMRTQIKNMKIKHLTPDPSIQQTDTSIILSSSKDKDRVIFVNKSASCDLLEREIPFRHIQNAQWIYLGTLLEKSTAVAQSIIEHGANKKVLLNFSSYLAQRGAKKLAPLLKRTTLLILNKREAHKLTIKKNQNTRQLLKTISSYGPKQVIITNGTKTIWGMDQNKMFTVSPPKVAVANTAGAGDAFNAGVLAGLIKKKSFENALLIGTVNAASVVQYMGTCNKHLTLREAEKLITKYKLKVRHHRIR